MKEFNTSQRLKQIMDIKNLRQVDILQAAEPYCKRFGIKLNKNDLSQYVSGKAVPRQDKLTILGLALDVSEAWLMGYDVSMARSDRGAKKYSKIYIENLHRLVENSNSCDVEAGCINMSEIERIINGEIPLTLDYACELAEEFGESINFMLRDNENNERKKSLDVDESTPRDAQEEQIISLVQNLVPEQKEFLIALLQTVVSRNQGTPAAVPASVGEPALKFEHRNLSK